MSKLPRPGQMVRVVWDDSDGSLPWRSLDDDDQGVGLHLAVAAGWYVSGDREAWTLALSIAVRRDQPGDIVSTFGRLRIPRGAIQEWQVIGT